MGITQACFADSVEETVYSSGFAFLAFISGVVGCSNHNCSLIKLLLELSLFTSPQLSILIALDMQM